MFPPYTTQALIGNSRLLQSLHVAQRLAPRQFICKQFQVSSTFICKPIQTASSGDQTLLGAEKPGLDKDLGAQK